MKKNQYNNKYLPFFMLSVIYWYINKPLGISGTEGFLVHK